ncbi:MAG: hypothetical protein ACYS8I_00320 [Planctomycetota bacterium]
MAKTRHIQTRMNQRGIDNKLLELASEFGTLQERGDVEKYVLSRKSIDATLRILDKIRGKLVKARDKGGIVLVTSDDGTDITTYRLDSYRRSRRY